jgi:histidinol-phosphate aminotransferase
VVAPEPTFVMYRLIATYAGLAYHGVPLRPDFALDLPAMLRSIEQHRPALVFLAWPNNPTGNLFDESAVRTLIAASPGLVVVDEAYQPFSGRTLVAALGEYPNLVILRTLSKMGLAGLRLGLLVGAPGWLAELDKLRLPYNINSLSQASAVFALRYGTVLTAQVQAICAERERLYRALAGLPALTVYPSQANFLLFRAPTAQGPRLFEALRRSGILIKNLDHAGPALRDCLRVTVGTPQENDAFLAALTRALSAPGDTAEPGRTG